MASQRARDRRAAEQRAQIIALLERLVAAVDGEGSYPTESDDDGARGVTAEDGQPPARPFDPGDYTVSDLRGELTERDLTHAQLMVLLEAEGEGEDRTTAKAAIRDRMSEDMTA